MPGLSFKNRLFQALRENAHEQAAQAAETTRSERDRVCAFLSDEGLVRLARENGSRVYLGYEGMKDNLLIKWLDDPTISSRLKQLELEGIRIETEEINVGSGMTHSARTCYFLCFQPNDKLRRDWRFWRRNKR